MCQKTESEKHSLPGRMNTAIHLLKGFLKRFSMVFVVTVKMKFEGINFKLRRSSLTCVGCTTELQSLMQSPHHSVVHAGDHVELKCRRGSSVPQPVILWYHTSSAIGSRRARVKPSERVAIGVDGTLLLLLLPVLGFSSSNCDCDSFGQYGDERIRTIRFERVAILGAVILKYLCTEYDNTSLQRLAANE